MEKIIDKRIIIKTIEEEVEMTLFVAKDGTIFDNEKECLEHEENIDFLSYFETKYRLKNIEPLDYGLNFGLTKYCNLVYIKKLSDKTIDEFVRFYDLNDHPDDIIKIKEGWSFVALRSDVNLWVFDQTDRLFTFVSINDIIKIKKNELNLLLEIER
jgi:hypothetical protein